MPSEAEVASPRSGKKDWKRTEDELREYYNWLLKRFAPKEELKAASQKTLEDLKQELSSASLSQYLAKTKVYLDGNFQDIKEMHEKSKLAKYGIIFSHLEAFSTIVDRFLQGVSSPANFIWGSVSLAFTLAKKEFTLFELLYQDLAELSVELKFASEVAIATIDTLASTDRIEEAVIDLYSVILEYWTEVPKLYHRGRLGGIRLKSLTYDHGETFGFQKAKINSRVSYLSKILSIETYTVAKDTYAMMERLGSSIDKLVVKDFIKVLNSQITIFEKGLDDKSGYRLAGTCLWIEQQPEYQAWLKHEKYVFWLAGQPGVGKTILATRLIHEASAQTQTQTQNQNQNQTQNDINFCLYCLCMHDQEKTLNYGSIIRSLCFQLFKHLYKQSKYAKQVESLMSVFSKYDGSAEQLRDTTSCFRELLGLIPNVKVTIYIDGLDEAPGMDIEEVVSWLWAFAPAPPNTQRVQVFVASRPTREISELLDKEIYKKECSRLNVSPEHVMNDIRHYVGSTLWPTISKRFPQWEVKRRCVVEKIPHMSHGQFQWAKLMVTELNACRDVTDVDQLLREETIPTSLDEMYSRIILRLEQTLPVVSLANAIRLLRWCACNLRPLRFEELAELLALRTQLGPDLEGTASPKAKDSIDKDITWGKDSANKKPEEEIQMIQGQEEDIRRICGCLVEFRPSDDKCPRKSTLHFIHLSIKEFLLKKSLVIQSSKQFKVFNRPGSREAKGSLMINEFQAHADLFWECVVYLSRRCFRGRLIETRGDAFELSKLSKHPLFSYAATSWPQHLVLSRDKHKTSSVSHLEGFFSSPEVRTWMEGAVALKGGLEWLHMIRFSIDRWLNDNGLDDKAPAYRNWAEDISGPAFMDYEATLLHNTNEIHYLDRHALFPCTIKSWPSRYILAEDIQEKLHDLGKSEMEFLKSLTAKADNIQTTTSFPTKLFIGESGDNNYGFIDQDLNSLDGQGGLLFVDSTLNHPRLVWEQLRESTGVPVPIDSRRARVRVASMHRCDKLGGHNLWTTLAATMSADGTALATVFSEQAPLHPGKVHLKTIVWEFGVTKECKMELQNWRNFFHTGYCSTDSPPDRPVIPSAAPADLTASWVTASELRLESELLVDKDDMFAGSKNLVAFHGQNQLIAPGGVFNLLTSAPERNPWEAIAKIIVEEATIIPGGERVIGFTKSREALAIVSLSTGDQYGVVTGHLIVRPRTLFIQASRFEHIVGCSDGGTHVCLTMKTKDNRLLVCLYKFDGKSSIIYTSPPGTDVQITHCKFDKGLKKEQASSKKHSKRKNRPNLVQYIAFVIEEVSLGKIYTLLAYSLKDVCLRLREHMPAKPEGLLFFKDTNKLDELVSNDGESRTTIDHVTLVALANGRRAMQYQLWQCNIVQQSDGISKAIAAKSQVLVATDYCCTPSPSENGRSSEALGFTLVTLESIPDQDTPQSLYNTEATIHSWIWKRLTEPCASGWELRAKSSLKLAPMNHRSKQLRKHGIASSLDLKTVAIWIGPTLQFVSTDPLSALPMDWLDQTIPEYLVCVGVHFSASSETAASLWECLPDDKDHRGWEIRVHRLESTEIRVHRLESTEILTTASIHLGSKPQSLEFHPSEEILAVSLVGELHIYQISLDGAALLVREVTSEALRGSLQVHKAPNGPASPPSTESTAVALQSATDQEDFAFGFSSCGNFMFNQSWNRFVDPEDPESDTAEPIIYRLAEEDSDIWKRISNDHPVIMEENRLYAAGQQRFKIFKIRSYLVLGWSADGTNLWWEKLEDHKPTWYRRVVCAIPLSFGNWRAILIWPKPRYERLKVILYPPQSLMEPNLPVSITSPLTPKQMRPSLKKGWLRGHAAGCPYHLGIKAKDNQDGKGGKGTENDGGPDDSDSDDSDSDSGMM